ncbi:STAS domain-containing protein [Nocardia pseudobrasiliensis]|uniref:Anti-anti-sigma factor n=1 Tax=Nocardia pseudobrasiliensis TaxID=45979 RepID=A0A370IFJ5_9NOCA|nr:STAS domain-containing protein [Nocardia pseudobrasiliensis]RDI68921.1 anti-anti-sigma factor [Nocardia pseudobrasiliensis]
MRAEGLPVHGCAGVRAVVDRDCGGECVVVWVSGEVDLCGASDFAAAIAAAQWPARRSGRMVIDLRTLSLFGAAGLHVLADIQRWCARERVRLWILADGAAVIGPLRATGLDNHLCVVGGTRPRSGG